MIELRICIDVDDLSKGIEFYTRGLGLTVGRRLDVNWVELLGASSPIDLLAKQSGSRPSPGSAIWRTLSVTASASSNFEAAATTKSLPRERSL